MHLIAQECQLSEEHGGCELHQVFAACVSHNTHPRLHNVELVSLISLGTDVQCIVSDAVLDKICDSDWQFVLLMYKLSYAEA